MGGEKRLGRKGHPQNGVTGGRAARDEGGEDRPLTNLKFSALAGAYQTGSAAALLVGAAQLEAVAAREAEVGQDEVQHVHPHELAAEEAPVATHLDVRQQTFAVLLMPTLAH